MLSFKYKCFYLSRPLGVITSGAVTTLTAPTERHTPILTNGYVANNRMLSDSEALLCRDSPTVDREAYIETC